MSPERLLRWVQFASNVYTEGPIKVTFRVVGDAISPTIIAEIKAEDASETMKLGPNDTFIVRFDQPLPDTEPNRETLMHLAVECYRHECLEWLRDKSSGKPERFAAHLAHPERY